MAAHRMLAYRDVVKGGPVFRELDRRINGDDAAVGVVA